MQHLSTLWKIANAASEVADLARSSESFQFAVEGDLTFYLHIDNAEVRVARWSQPRIEVEAHLQAPFGWRIETDQDEAGVYFVARRRPVVGGLSGATFAVTVPDSIFCTLKLENGRLTLEGVTGTIELPPPGSKGEFPLRQAES
jgi:hypothetical protein